MIGILIAAFVASLFTPNPFLTAGALLLLVWVVAMTWRPGETPVLLFAAGYQWLQGTLAIFIADVQGVRYQDLFPRGDHDKATWLTMVGLAVLTGAMRVGVGRLPAPDPDETTRDIQALNARRLWNAYLIAFILELVLGRFIFVFGGLSQILLSALQLKWFFFFLLAVTILVSRKGGRYLGWAMVLEVVVGFAGFFSLFKEVFFALILAAGAAHRRVRARATALVAVSSVCLLILGAYWMAVRRDYRKMLSGGEKAQVVQSSVSERFLGLRDLIADVEMRDLVEGIGALVERLSYVEYFGYVTENVPARVDYEGGVLWRAALIHILTPRLLWPNKPVLASDSELTARYVGPYLTVEEGTSISMGYMAESYVDFGPLGMMFPIAAVGLLWGLMYRFFMTRHYPMVFRMAAATSVLVSANKLEMASVKLLGALVMSFLLTTLFLRYLVPVLVRYLKGVSRRPVDLPPIRSAAAES